MRHYYILLLLLASGIIVSCQSSRTSFVFGDRPAPTPYAAMLAPVPDSARPAATPVFITTTRLAAPPQPRQRPGAISPRRGSAAAPPRALRLLVRRVVTAAAGRPRRLQLVRPQAGHRSAAPVILLLSAGALARPLAVGTLDVGLVGSLIGLACLAAVSLLLMVRTISQARSNAARRARMPLLSKGSWLQIAAWTLGLGGLALGILLGGWLGALVAVVLIGVAVLLGLTGSFFNGNMP